MFWNDISEMKKKISQINEDMKGFLDFHDNFFKDKYTLTDVMDKLHETLDTCEKIERKVEDLKPEEFEKQKQILKNMIETFQKYYVQQKSLSDILSKLDDIEMKLDGKKTKPRKRASKKKEE